MAKPIIVVDITPEADVNVTVKGVKGKSCKDVTKQLETALGATVKDTATKEMYENGGTQIVSRS